MIVDDDSSVSRLIKAALEGNGYKTMAFASGEDALEELSLKQVDGIILDIILPGIDGLEVLKKIRANSCYKKIPVIMLTTKSGEIETVLGLELGADDYLSKPVRYHELLTRMKKIFMKMDMQPKTEENFVEIHGIKIDLDSREAYCNNIFVPMTYMEYELLQLLVRNPGKVFTREQLLDLLWSDSFCIETRTVDVHIRRIRQKLEESGINPHIIESVRSVGYRLSSKAI